MNLIEPAFRGLGIDIEWFAEEYRQKVLEEKNEIWVNSDQVKVKNLILQIITNYYKLLYLVSFCWW